MNEQYKNIRPGREKTVSIFARVVFLAIVITPIAVFLLFALAIWLLGEETVSPLFDTSWFVPALIVAYAATVAWIMYREIPKQFISQYQDAEAWEKEKAYRRDKLGVENDPYSNYSGKTQADFSLSALSRLHLGRAAMYFVAVAVGVVAVTALTGTPLLTLDVLFGIVFFGAIAAGLSLLLQWESSREALFQDTESAARQAHEAKKTGWGRVAGLLAAPDAQKVSARFTATPKTATDWRKVFRDTFHPQDGKYEPEQYRGNVWTALAPTLADQELSRLQLAEAFEITFHPSQAAVVGIPQDVLNDLWAKYQPVFGVAAA